jgi:outer membrane protein OmpA-like peptidoglycan-associated protein
MGLKKSTVFKFYSLNKLSLKMAKIIAGVFLGTIITGACSQIPDAVNPAEWYRGTLDYFTDEDINTDKNKKQSKLDHLSTEKANPTLSTNEDFPNLALVDKQARARENIKSGLPADPERPKYAPAIKRQGLASLKLSSESKPITKAISVPKPLPATISEKTQPAPPAMPKPFVAQSPGPINLSKEKPKQVKKTFSPKAVEEQMKSQKRIVRQLNEIRSRSGINAPPLNMVKAFALGGDDLSTIVISSQGVSLKSTKTTASQASELVIPSSISRSASRLTTNKTKKLGNEIKVATIFYDNGSYKLKVRDRKILNQVALIQQKEGGYFRIVGHASSRTRNLTPIKHKMVNFKISIDRADEIASALVKLGINKKNIQVAAVSDSQPAYHEFMLSGEAGNRRTEIYLTR